MKVISILQPWASLVVLGHKKIETRSWNTKYRGELLIHASAKFTKQQEALSHEFYMMMRDSRIYHCHRGAIIGKVNLEAIIETDNIDSSADIFQQEMLINADRSEFRGNSATISPQEYAFGDYSEGRFGWLLSDPVLFDNPIPCKGQLGLWNFDLTQEQIKKP